LFFGSLARDTHASGERSVDLLSAPYKLDRIYLSMRGPRSNQPRIELAPAEAAEKTLWLTGMDIAPNGTMDVRTDTYSAGGPGGQHVNKTQSAVRLTHIPTNIVVQCQDQRSQTRNRELAWKALKSKLYDHFEELKAKERRDLRRTQVGTGDRSDKIRTYNFKENRVTDHRIGLTLHSLDNVLAGQLDELTDALAADERSAQLVGGDA
jgi:peptide chain release factor 1